MTEAEWQACSDPAAMLAALDAGRACPRKLRLFVCACGRRVAHLTQSGQARRALVLAECYADGLVGRRRWLAAQRAVAPFGAVSVELLDPRTAWRIFALRAAAASVANLTVERAAEAAADAAEAIRYESYGYWSRHDPGEDRWDWVPEIVRRSARAEQADWLRCVFGDPSHLHSFDPRWRTPAVVALARQGSTSRGLASLPVLADALEEAGCLDAALLGHLRLPAAPAACRYCGGAAAERTWVCCRSAPRTPPPRHVRGCWALDLILGRS